MVDVIKTEADAFKIIDKIAVGVSDKTALRALAETCFAWGAGNNNASCVPLIERFNKRFRGGNTGRPVLTGDSEKTYNSAFGAYGVLGSAPWKMPERELVLNWCLSNLGQPYGTRSSIIKAIADLKEAPAITVGSKTRNGVTTPTYESDACDAIVEANKKPANMEALASRVKKLHKSVKDLGMLDTDRADFVPEFRDTLLKAETDVKRAYAEAVKALDALVKIAAGTKTVGQDELADA